MPGIAELALAGAPIAGGALLGIAAGNLRAPDLRETIRKDMDLLESLPPEQTERRAELQRVIDLRIDDIIASVDKNRSMREAAMSYTGNWRDIVVFICGVLFTIVWATAVDPTKRANYWIMLVVLILATLVAGAYAARGAVRALRTYLRERRSQ